MGKKNYRVGIDVGLNSVGFAAVEVDEEGFPLSLLNSVVYVHDAGVDPTAQKTGVTRRAISGQARRARRLVRKRKKRLEAVDNFLAAHGYPLPNLEEFEDPYEPWLTRKQLAEEKLEGEAQKEAIVIAVRHMARHRGWRSPWDRPESLQMPAPESKFLKEFREKVMESTGVLIDEGATPAQAVCELISDDARLRPNVRIRGVQTRDTSGAVEVIPFGKMHQSDNANELRTIARIQGLDDAFVRNLIDCVFKADSPKGKAGERAGMDALPGQGGKPRAGRWCLAFQRFKIVAHVANMRIQEDGGERMLTPEEKQKVIAYLMAADGKNRISWGGVAENALEMDRNVLAGSAKASIDGERPSANPPTNTTNERIEASNATALKKWWRTASEDAREAMLADISNGEDLDEDAPGAEEALAFLAEASEEDLVKLDKVANALPSGRAAYSRDSLERLTAYMLEHSVDLFTARKEVFGVPDDWHPPADPIGMPVGNPAVDRVLKIVNRYLMAARREYGDPAVINIEHVRSGFGSVKMAREYENALKKRNERNQQMVDEMRERGITSASRSAREKYAAVRRQNCQCLYCGHEITYETCEMDHIVPRKGEGSTNTRNNLVAACRDCNHAKSNIPFAVWAARTDRRGVSYEEAKERVCAWIPDSGMNAKEWRNFQFSVLDRLRKTTEDDAIDNRSMESVAWMANELRARIAAEFAEAGTVVNVYRGAITAAGRKASGFEGKVKLIGGNGKTRLDRRHHAMDAATIALMRPGISQTLAIRENMRAAEWLSGKQNSWREFPSREGAQKEHFEQWVGAMEALCEMFNAALEEDAIPVIQNLRLRLGNSKAHDDTLHKMKHKRVGEAWSLAEIDQAETPALWCALTRCADFDSEEGLPANPARRIRVRGQEYGPGDAVGIFGKNIAGLKVRGGWAEIGNTIHHARIYRIKAKKPTYAMIRVFSCDLARHRGEDLFTAQLPPQSISLRTAEPKLRAALAEGTAEYLGWLAVGDELLLDLSDPAFAKGQIGALQAEFGEQWPAALRRWKVTGFFSPSKLRLRPVLLAGEGLANMPEEVDANIEKVIAGPGWLPAINVLGSKAQPAIIRRNTLGQERWHSRSHLPISQVLAEG